MFNCSSENKHAQQATVTGIFHKLYLLYCLKAMIYDNFIPCFILSFYFQEYLMEQSCVLFDCLKAMIYDNFIPFYILNKYSQNILMIENHCFIFQ